MLLYKLTLIPKHLSHIQKHCKGIRWIILGLLASGFKLYIKFMTPKFPTACKYIYKWNGERGEGERESRDGKSEIVTSCVIITLYK